MKVEGYCEKKEKQKKIRNIMQMKFINKYILKSHRSNLKK